jgi:hypothetical protein
MEKRWVVRRSEPVKEVLLIEGRVYPGGAQGTIGLRIQKGLDIKKYRRTRTSTKIGTIGWELAFRAGEHRGPSSVSRDRHPEKGGCDRGTGGECQR